MRLELTPRAMWRQELARQLSVAASTSSSTKNLTRSDQVSLRNFQNVLYTAPIRIHQREFRVQIDTGSADLWVSCAFLDQRDVPTLFNACGQYAAKTTTPTTCPSDGKVIRYGSGDVCVLPTNATIQFGSVEIADYVVGIALGANVMPSAQDPILSGGAEGILGLAYSSIATIPSPNGQFIDQISNFSIHLQANRANHRLAPATLASEASSGSKATVPAGSTSSFMILNGVDQKFIDDNNLTAQFVPLKSASHWTVSLGQVVFGQQVLSTPCSQPQQGFCNAIVDSGTSLVSMPQKFFDMFVASYLQPTECVLMNEDNSIYACRQSFMAELPTIGLTLGSAQTGWTTFQLTPEDYTMVDWTSGLMMIELQPNPQGLETTWILGDTFLRAYYSLYLVDQGVSFYCPNGKCHGVENVVSAQDTSSASSKTSWYKSGVFWGILGAVVFVLLVVASWFVWSRRQRRRLGKRFETDMYMNQEAALVPETAFVQESSSSETRNNND